MEKEENQNNISIEENQEKANEAEKTDEILNTENKKEAIEESKEEI